MADEKNRPEATVKISNGLDPGKCHFFKKADIFYGVGFYGISVEKPILKT
jgi:hypothetical protein